MLLFEYVSIEQKGSWGQERDKAGLSVNSRFTFLILVSSVSSSLHPVPAPGVAHSKLLVVLLRLHLALATLCDDGSFPH